MIHKFVSLLRIVPVALLIAVATPLQAQINIPSTSGFSGYVSVLPGFINASSNTIASGAPAMDDVGFAQITSINEAPLSKSVFAFGAVLDINYTFAKTKTQVFAGNRLEDILRLDLTFGIGIRQELPDSSIVALSFVLTPFELKYWADPFVEGQDREKTRLKFPGVRFRWHRMFRTGLEFTATYRLYRFEMEKSGEWLVGQNRLLAAQRPLLLRDGNVLRLQLLYRLRKGKHLFEPAIRWANDFHEGAALANRGGSIRLTYMYLTPKAIFDVNVGFGRYQADAIHPVYNETLESNQFGAGAIVIVPVKQYESSRLSLMVNSEIIVADRNVAFYDSQLTAVFFGVIWNHIRR